MVWVHMAHKDRVDAFIWRVPCYQREPHFFGHHLVSSEPVWEQRVEQDCRVPIAHHDPFIAEIGCFGGCLWVRQRQRCGGETDQQRK